jgi:hypothetical protein
MESRTAYCSACDKDVRVVITDEPSQDGQANVHDSEVVCLEIGDACTGSLCPIGATSPTVMAARLVRNGLQTIVQPVFQAMCPGCDRVTSHVIVERSHAICEDCGKTTPRTELTILL